MIITLCVYVCVCVLGKSFQPFLFKLAKIKFLPENILHMIDV